MILFEMIGKSGVGFSGPLYDEERKVKEYSIIFLDLFEGFELMWPLSDGCVHFCG